MPKWSNQQQNYYRSQAAKRLAVIYRSCYGELETGLRLSVYGICHNAGVDLHWMLNNQEWSVWRAQRIWGFGLHCYPEFIICNDVVDFADPIARIVIEVDSKLHSRVKDEAKDKRLADAGYDVFRIDGRYTKQDIKHVQETIQALGDHGKEDERIKKMAELEHNDERVIMRIRDELRQIREAENSHQDIDKTAIITMGEYVKTKEFKRYIKFSTLTDELRAEIEAIPLYLKAD